MTLKQILRILLMSCIFSCADKPQTNVTRANDTKRELGDNLFLNLYSHMSESMYYDSINSLVTRSVITSGNYIKDGTNLETDEYTLTVPSIKSKNPIDIKGSVLPIIKSDSLVGVKLTFTRFYDPMQFDYSPCSDSFSEVLAESLIDLYTSKYGSPQQPAALNETERTNDHKFYLWYLNEKTVFISQATGTCISTSRKSLYQFEIVYMNKDYFKKTQWNPEFIEENRKKEEINKKEKLEKTKDNI